MRKLLLGIFLPFQLMAQTQTFRPFKKYPFPSQLTTASTGANIAWAMDEQGRRNLFAATGPDFTPRQLTDYTKNDGQELSGVTISNDGKWAVFVRGGDHGANWGSDEPVNTSFDAQPFKVQIVSIPLAGGTVKYLSEGDEPTISPDSKKVAFIKGGQAWSVPVDGSAPAKNCFTTRGEVGSLQWSPDSKRLLFVTNRKDHSIIGIYTPADSSLTWIAPSFTFDDTPQWSNDGSKIVFVRQPGAGGAPDSLLPHHQMPWSLYIADTTGSRATLLWKAPVTPRGSFPYSEGEANLHWASGDHIVFLSYQDGWPHLYTIDAKGGKETLLTPGGFMCEHIRLSPDKKHLLFSANTGLDPHDIDRRHAAMVSVDKPDMQVITPGTGLEWTPAMTGDGTTVFISATPQRPPLPAVMTAKEKTIRLLCQDRIAADFPRDKFVIPTPVIFQSADGVTVHADLFMPPAGASGGAAGTKRPALVYVHGGPPREMLLGWHYSDYYSNAYASNQYLASLGFVVLAVNYRLGIGYGYEFQQPAKAGPAGASEYLDIRAAGEWLRKQSFVDSGKIGIYGGSYGGYLTALALGRDSKIFAAGVDFHGVHDWLAQAGITGMKDKYEKAPDLDIALKTIWQSSPVSSVDTWKSPVLIIQGDDDRNVRVSQSIDLIQRLEKKGVPYETLMIVDDTHHWMNFDNAVTVYTAAAEFFVRKFMK